MTIVQGTNPTATRVVTTVTLNNTPFSTESRPVNYVVINNAVVQDPSKVNPCVLINKQ